jgi:hypothetical protein
MTASMRRVALAGLLAATAAGSDAHETKSADQYRLTIGWGDEPAFAGYRNSIDLDVADGSGKPVSDLGGGSLSVEVVFADARRTLPLLPGGGPPGRFRAFLVPTRAGSYTFRVTGTVRGRAIDLTSACSESTFHCVEDAGELQFPVKDASAGQLSESVSRALPRADAALGAARSAQTLALAGLGLAAAALVAGFVRRSREDPRAS